MGEMPLLENVATFNLNLNHPETPAANMDNADGDEEIAAIIYRIYCHRCGDSIQRKNSPKGVHSKDLSWNKNQTQRWALKENDPRMMLRLKVSRFRLKQFNAVRGRLSQNSGNILVYIVMIMVIFAVLGVAMVSLFSTSAGSFGDRERRQAGDLPIGGRHPLCCERTAGGGFLPKDNRHHPEQHGLLRQRGGSL